MVFALFQATNVGNFASSISSEVVLIIGIALVLIIIFKTGKFVLGALTNSILGLISIFALNSIFSLGIPVNLLTIVATAIFGLPAVVIMVLLRLIGINF
ncbi:MAG: pro-sigmaK processing inhibitor BofA family protein [Candidatus Micrarchaeota archaeon]|nr:pro-sigmaK processing inhibitor BofA family protein [Candidatus Micrarchaeota archaeon]